MGGRGEGLEKNYRKCLTLDQFLDLFAVYLAIKIRVLEEVPPDVYNKEFCGWVILEYDSPNPCSPIQGSSSIQFCLEYYKFICLHILPTFFFFPWYYARTYFGKGERADLQFPTYDIFLWVLLLHLNVWLRGEKDKWDMSGILFIDASSYSSM